MRSREITKRQPGEGKSPWKKTDKCVQAEIKNRVEAFRLNLYTKVLEKDKLHQEFSVNREKRMVVKGMEKMKKQTTGICVAGVPPDGPNDTSYHKSKYFHGGATVSEKQLQKWRVKERKVEKEKIAFKEEYGALPWERNSSEIRFGQSFHIVMGLMGYDGRKIEKIITKHEENKEKGQMSLKIHKKKVGDVFECLRENDDTQNQSGHKQSLKSQSFGSGFSERQFSVDDWESDLIKDYTQSLTQHNPRATRKKPYGRIQSAPEGRISQPSINPAWQAQVEEPKKSTIRVRPHSAILPSSISPRSPMSPKSPSLSARELKSINELSTPDSEFLSVTNTPRSPVTSARELKTVDELNPPDLEASHQNNITSTKGTFVSAKRLNSIQELNTSDAEFKETDADSIVDLADGSKKNETTTVDSPDAALPNDNTDDKGVEARREYAVEDTEAPLYTPKQTDSKESFVRKSSNLAYATRSANASLPSTSINMPCATKPANASFESNPSSNTLQKTRPAKKPTVITSMQRKQSGSAQIAPKTKEPSREKVDATLKVTDSIAMRQLPQWKRDLMREAPPSLAGAKGPEKVNLIMSRSQRRRELQKLVEENVGDVKQICNEERSRRMQSRVKMFMTMMQVQHAAGNLEHVQVHDAGVTSSR